MKTVHLFAIIAILSSTDATEALASGAGLRQYQPAKVVKPVCYNCPTGQCQSGALCSGCQLEGATPPPCTADGSCTPNHATYGFNQTRWRRWPGDYDGTGPTPADETAGDSLLTPFDTPAPEEEDQQAPPPIEDDPGVVEEGEELPLLEIDLPPLPEPNFDAPATPVEDEPPALPFGAAPARSSSMPSMAEERSLPSMPALREQPIKRSGGFRAIPASLPSKRNEANAPPALPEGFTRHDTAQPIRRLPQMTQQAAAKRVDTLVRPVAAIEPLLLRADR